MKHDGAYFELKASYPLTTDHFGVIGLDPDAALLYSMMSIANIAGWRSM